MTHIRSRQEVGPGVGNDGHKKLARLGHNSTGTSRRPHQVMMSIRMIHGLATMTLRRKLGRAHN